MWRIIQINIIFSIIINIFMLIIPNETVSTDTEPFGSVLVCSGLFGSVQVCSGQLYFGLGLFMLGLEVFMLHSNQISSEGSGSGPMCGSGVRSVI